MSDNRTTEQAIAELRKTVRDAFSGESVSMLVEGNTIMQAIGEVETATIGGTLTAEQVRETIDKHWHDLPAEYDMPEATALPEYSYDWQAIADELNATLGGGICHMSFIDEYEHANGDESYLCECSECGSQTWEPAHDLPLYCRKCGKAVKRWAE